jgi:hypothetical protein
VVGLEVEVLVLASEVERRVVVDSTRSWVCAIRDAKTAGLFMLLCCDATLCRIIVSVRRLDVIRTGVLGNSVRWHFEYPPFQLFQLCTMLRVCLCYHGLLVMQSVESETAQR